MIRFDNDYTEGCHPSILEALVTSNKEQTPGYGEDLHCKRARFLVRYAVQDQSAGVHFLTGGTQANLTVISAALRPHQGVLCADTGHINRHESGAIEATGHKVISLPSDDGKITAAQIEEAYWTHWNDPSREHTVQPGMVYISHPTENGTVYTKEELTEISKVCRKRSLYLYLDGARLGYGLAAVPDLTPGDLGKLCDVFCIGGTKVGALFGEAVVIIRNELKRDFRYHLKQRGGMLAKGRLLGLQFECLMKDDMALYTHISKHAVEQGMKVRAALERMRVPLRYDSPTNQQFPILPDQALARLSESYAFCPWEKPDDKHTVVRICTSWCTPEKDVDQLISDLKKAL